MRAAGILIGALVLVLIGVSLAPACTVSTTPVAFGSYDPLLATATDTTGSISVFCAVKTTITVKIGASSNSGGFDPRQMANGPDRLNYNLFINAGRTTIWGDGSGGTSVNTATVPKNQTRNLTIYGRIPPLQGIPAGNFSETLVVTVTY